MDHYDYQVCEDTDSEGYDSSSSEDAFVAYVRKTYLSQAQPEDDFEKEMEDELSATVRDFEQRQLYDAGASGGGASVSTSDHLAMKGQGSSSTEKGSEADAGLHRSKAKRKKPDDTAEMVGVEASTKTKVGDAKADKDGPSNDDLFYDPEMDDEDEKWVNEQRRDCIFPGASKDGKDGSRVKPLPLSDAVLNCPGCMTLLCLDCQRHEIYNTQYRAMFVKNCVVDTKVVLKYFPSRTSRRRRDLPDGVVDPRNIFNPVRCQVCRTEVAVYDRDEVYHFFNVIASF
ncbi:E2F-associated phosphoprotein-like [Amblyomma americanum]|uniref:E2f-associated phosphoprotein n=1 Tax=Amblyomma americanum TaxID=6943 RepID=A0AAQ4F476_AMBAM